MVGNKPYMKKAYIIDNPLGSGCVQIWSMAPVGVLGKKKKKKKRLLVYDSNMEATGLVLYDISERTFPNFCLSFQNGETPTTYFPSLITIYILT